MLEINARMEKRTPKREVEMRILIDIGHPAHVHLFKNMKIYWLVQMLKIKTEERRNGRGLQMHTRFLERFV